MFIKYYPCCWNRLFFDSWHRYFRFRRINSLLMLLMKHNWVISSCLVFRLLWRRVHFVFYTFARKYQRNWILSTHGACLSYHIICKTKHMRCCTLYIHIRFAVQNTLTRRHFTALGLRSFGMPHSSKCGNTELCPSNIRVQLEIIWIQRIVRGTRVPSSYHFSFWCRRCHQSSLMFSQCGQWWRNEQRMAELSV